MDTTVTAHRISRVVGRGWVSAVLGCVLTLGSASAQINYTNPPATVPLANLQVVDSDVLSYRPFTVKASFTKAYCLSAFPGFADVKLRTGVLSIQLSHLQGRAGCVSAQAREFQVAGLPAGTYRLRVALTGSYAVEILSVLSVVQFDSYEAEASEIAFTVKRHPGEAQLGLCTAQYTRSGVVAVGLYPSSGCTSSRDNLSDQRLALEVASLNYERPGSFFAFTFSNLTSSGAAQPVPPTGTPFQRLYILTYPTPLEGRYATLSKTECSQVAAAWALPATSCMDGQSSAPDLYVLPARNGACPLGSSPVYQLFHPGVVAHRYTQTADTYSHLMNYGYVGEGVVWCAPARE